MCRLSLSVHVSSLLQSRANFRAHSTAAVSSLQPCPTCARIPTAAAVWKQACCLALTSEPPCAVACQFCWLPVVCRPDLSGLTHPTIYQQEQHPRCTTATRTWAARVLLLVCTGVELNMTSTTSLANSLTRALGTSPLKGSGSPRQWISSLGHTTRQGAGNSRGQSALVISTGYGGVN